MSTSLTALFLAIVLLWSGLAGHEQATASATIAARAPGEGSVDGLHLDHLAAQAHVEHQADTEVALGKLDEALRSELTMTRPIHAGVAALAEPYLDGLQRPPCPTLLTA